MALGQQGKLGQDDITDLDIVLGLSNIGTFSLSNIGTFSLIKYRHG